MKISVVPLETQRKYEASVGKNPLQMCILFVGLGKNVEVIASMG